MSRIKDTTLGRFHVKPDFNTDLGILKVGETIPLNLLITCKYSNVRVCCEQETNKNEKEVGTCSIQFKKGNTDEEKVNVENTKIEERKYGDKKNKERRHEEERKYGDKKGKESIKKEKGIKKVKEDKPRVLKIKFTALKGGNVVLLITVEKFQNNRMYSDEELETLNERIELKYQTTLSNFVNIPDEEIDYLEEVGSDQYGIMNKATYDGESVIVKTYNLSFREEEIDGLMFMNHDYIVQYKRNFHRIIDGESRSCVMMEYSKHGNLYSKQFVIELRILYKIMEDVCKALKFLHNQKHVIHKGINPYCIMIFEYDKICNVNAKLTNFGNYERINSEGNNGRKNIEKDDEVSCFIAPEVINGESYSEKCDVYSLGITMLLSFTKNDYKYICGDVVQPDGTYIKQTSCLQGPIRNLVIKCCQVNPSNRPLIDECLSTIREIRTRMNNKEILNSINVEQEGVRYSLPKFDLLESIKVVVESIKELKVNNDFIKAFLMLKFGQCTEDAINNLKNNSFSYENTGDADYCVALYYLNKNSPNSLNMAYELMIKAAGKYQPDAIKFLIDILIDIAEQKITIYDDEKLQIKEIINKRSDNLETKDIPLQPPTQTIDKTVISTTVVVHIFSVLKNYVPLCKLHYGIALLHGVGIKANVFDAETVFISYSKSSFITDPEEVKFYQAYCKFTKNNIENSYIEAYNKLNECITSSKQQYYYSDALNNKGVLLYKGKIYGENINEAFDCFKQSMELNNEYGKFNYAFCLFEQEKISSTSLTKEDGLKIIDELANNDSDIAQRFSSIQCYKKYLQDNKDELLQNTVYWLEKATLQLDYIAANNLGCCFLSGLGVNKDESIGFSLFNVAAKNGKLYAQINLANCYKFGKGIKQNLEEAKNWLEKALESIENDETKNGDIKTEVEYKYLIVLRDLFMKNKDQSLAQKFLELSKKLEAKGHVKSIYDWGVCHLHGIIVQRNGMKAVECFEKASEEGYGQASFALGTMYSQGQVVRKDEKKAIEYFKRAAEKEHVQAYLALGMMYLQEQGVDQNAKEAIEYFEKAANKESGRAYFALGMVYLQGKGVERDLEKAKWHFEEAKKRGDEKAQDILDEYFP